MKCDVCGAEVGMNDKVFTDEGGALCADHMHRYLAAQDRENRVTMTWTYNADGVINVRIEDHGAPDDLAQPEMRVSVNGVSVYENPIFPGLPVPK